MGKTFCERCTSCSGRFFSILLFVLEIIVPGLCIGLPIGLLNTYLVAKITLTISTCLLALIWMTIGIKLYTDSKKEWFQGDDMLCANPAKFSNLIVAGNIMYPAVPWSIVNIVFIGVWGDRLVQNDIWIIILGTIGILYMFLVGLSIGYSFKKHYPNGVDCFKSILSINLYIWFCMVFIIMEAWPIRLYNTYNVAFVTICVNTGLLTVACLIMNIRIWIDAVKEEQANSVNQYSYSSDYKAYFCLPPSQFKSLICSGFFLAVVCPWYIVNIICIGVWGTQFINNGATWLVALGVTLPAIASIIGTAIGYAYTREFYND